MLNRDRPLGQRRGDGYVFGNPWAPKFHRAEPHHSVTKMRKQFGWRDRVGLPHGRSGDKLSRKAAIGSIGLGGSRRGPLGFMLNAKSTSGRHQR